MNVLVDALRRDAAWLARFRRASTVAYGDFAELLERDPATAPLAAAIAADVVFGSAFAQAFAGVVDREEWEAAQAEAAAAARVPATWVTLVRVPGEEIGVTLPQDRSDVPTLSLFARSPDVVRRVSVVRLDDDYGEFELRTGGGECGEPYRNVCESGTCSKCVKRNVNFPREEAGRKCFCVDDTATRMARGRSAVRAWPGPIDVRILGGAP